MKNQSYRIILEGTIKDGFQRDDVITNLCRLFKKDARTVENLLSSAPRLIRKGLTVEEARKYEAALSKAGAGVRIQPEQPVPAAPVETREADPSVEAPAPASPPRLEPAAVPAPAVPPDGAGAVCPKCGYTATSEDDVLLGRGDCPRCGLRVRKDVWIGDMDSDREEGAWRETRSDNLYEGRTPASWGRRACASIHTFSLFMAIYTGLFFVLVFLLVPVNFLLPQMGKRFISTAFEAFPMLLISMAVVVVSFGVPIWNRGLSLGQLLAGIEVLYTEEALVGGLYMALACRVLGILAISFVPGLIVLRIASWFGSLEDLWASSLVMIGMAAVTWAGFWIYGTYRKDKRGILDLVTGTAQTEERPMPPDAWKKSLLSLAGVIAIWVLFGAIIPLLIRIWS